MRGFKQKYLQVDTDTYKRMKSRIEELEAKCARLQSEAESHAMEAQAVAVLDRLREALKSCPCPCAAANGWHGAFTIGRCNIVGECECRYGKALAVKEKDLVTAQLNEGGLDVMDGAFREGYRAGVEMFCDGKPDEDHLVAEMEEALKEASHVRTDTDTGEPAVVPDGR